MRILNLTQHRITEKQANAGVTEPREGDRLIIKELLTFDDIPYPSGIHERAKRIAEIATEYNVKSAMIGGAPYLMSALEQALMRKGIEPVYAFSERISMEQTLEDGSVVKKAVFKHKGFVRPFGYIK